MRQYDVFENPSPRTRKLVPYLVVLQSDLASETEAVIVAPLSQAIPGEGSRLYPELAIVDGYYTMLTPDLASVSRVALKKRVANVGDAWHRITAAVDILFTGI